MKTTMGFGRRKVLRGMMGGAAVAVGMPFLDCFLNSNGTALASGQALPLCFGTWFWALGADPGWWEPKTTGTKYEFGQQLQVLQPFRDDINVFSGLKVALDANPNAPHAVGPTTFTTGSAKVPSTLPTIDTIIADAIGTRTRFRSLEVACDGTKSSFSRRTSSSNPSESSPAALYARIFGPEFKDPNAADFTPDPRDMMRRSALSAITEQRQDVMQKIGKSDRARLDDYFTALRELEQQLDLALQKPAPLEACTVPSKQDEATVGYIIEDAITNHKLFSGLLAHALACGQTQVFNVLFSEGISNLRRAGSAMTYHMYTHEEAPDAKLGIQVEAQTFRAQIHHALTDLVTTMKGIKEGDGTLLDRSLIMAFSDVGLAKTHNVENIPFLTVGKAGGHLKTGYHIAAGGDTVARAGLTIQQAMGVRVSSWGTELNLTSKPFAELLA